MSAVSDIRDSVNTFVENVVFRYGRDFDTSLASAKNEISEWFVHLDPVTINANITDNGKTATITMGFLKQDSPDSEYDQDSNLEISDSIEEIQDKAGELAWQWLDYFIENNARYSAGNYSVQPVTRIKNCMSGVLLQFTLTFATGC